MVARLPARVRLVRHPAQPFPVHPCQRTSTTAEPKTGSPVDDQHLIARIQQGDPAAERAMYDAHVDRVWRLVFRIVGDSDTAQDCVQEAYARAWAWSVAITRPPASGTAARTSLSRWSAAPSTSRSRPAARAGARRPPRRIEDAFEDGLERVEVARGQRTAALPRLVDGAPLADNLRAVLHAGLDVMTPYHGFGTTFVQQALPVSSPASPFSAESGGARAMAVDLMVHVVASSKVRMPGGLRDRLPDLLWLLYLGVTLHWVVDPSPAQQRTRSFVDRLAPVVSKAVALSRLPVARGLVDDVVALPQHSSGSLR